MKEFIDDLKRGVIDVNALESFFGIVIKGFLYKLNNTLVVRGEFIPHIIINTGDDTMYLEVKGHNMGIEPMEVSNEDFVYGVVPRCVVTPGAINIQTDQLSQWSVGNFQVEHDEVLVGIRSRFRRFPLKITCTLKYYLDTYNDALSLAQQIISKEAFVNNFEVDYLGQKIFCSYTLPEGQDIEKNIEFDGFTTDSKNKTITFDFEIDTNLPVLLNESIVESDSYIRTTVVEVKENA